MSTKRLLYPVATALRKVPLLHIPLAVLGISAIVVCAFILVLFGRNK